MRRLIVPLALVSFFVFVAGAQAHDEVASPACTPAAGNTVIFNWSDFTVGSGNGGVNAPTWQVIYTPTIGSPVTLNGSVSFTGTAYSYTVSIPSGAASVIAYSAWTTTTTTDSNAGSRENTFTVPNCLASPAISTTASPGVVAGGSISDEAVLSGGRAPTGTITFNLYSASDTTCSTPLASGTSTVNGNGSYSSPSVTESTPGTYQWTASYSGDANNSPVSEGCNESAEQVTVTTPPPTPTPPTPTPPTPTPPTPTPPTPTPPAHPSIVTTASPSSGCSFTHSTPSCKISDKAVLSGGNAPTGTITFKLYTASDTTCSTSLDTKTVNVTHGNGSYDSPVYTTTKAVAYQWTASYSGDGNNESVAEGCGQRAEQVPVVTPKASCVAVPVFLRGVFGTRAGSFVARLTALGVKSVTFYLDGHKVGTVTKSHDHFFSITINTAPLSFGMHHLVAKVTMKNTSCKGVRREGSFVHGVPPFS
jgi:hypothetical protein